MISGIKLGDDYCRMALPTIQMQLANRCVDWKRYDGENPTRKVMKFEESEGEVRFLTEEEEIRLLAAANEPLRTIILLGISTGLRILAEASTPR